MRHNAAANERKTMRDNKVPPENTTFKTVRPVTLWSRLRPASGIADGISYQVPAGTVATLIRHGKHTDKLLCTAEHNGRNLYGWLLPSQVRSVDIVELILGPL